MISIIVPVYKTEAYLRKCLDSITQQTYQDFEVILVDDGSPDKCGEICDQYPDKRFRVIHKQNGGLSDARNAGIRIAKGDYITFVDSDDWVEPTLLEVLMDGIQQGATVSCCGFYTVRNGRKIPWRQTDKKYHLLSAVDAVKDMMYTHSIDTSAWGKLFHRSCFMKIQFPVGHLYEEVATTYRLMLTQERIAIITQPLYNYVKHSGSIVSSYYSGEQKDMLYYSLDMLSFAEKEQPELISAARRRIVYSCFYLLKTMGRRYKDFPDDVKEIMSQFKQFKGLVFRDAEVSRRDKEAILLLSVGVSAFEYVWSIYSQMTGRHGNA